MSDPAGLPELIDVRQADQLRAAGVALVDVREQHEWEAGHIDGVEHIPFASLSAHAARIDKQAPVVFVCRSGGRSAVATQVFRSSGYDAHNMAGGMLEWVAQELPIAPSDGTIAEH